MRAMLLQDFERNRRIFVCNFFIRSYFVRKYIKRKKNLIPLFSYDFATILGVLLIPDDYYIEYDVENDRVLPGFPRKIKDDFSPDNSSAEGIPDNLDSVYYDMITKKMVFFKGEYVSIQGCGNFRSMTQRCS